MDIETQTKFLKLKGFLNSINHISYTYAEIGKRNPHHSIDQVKAEQLIKVYEGLLDEVKSLILNYGNTRMDKTA